MKFNKSLGLLIFFAASLFHTTTFAQNLSLEEAINLALERNYQIQISKKQIDIADRT
jgi:hypothetical protein